MYTFIALFYRYESKIKYLNFIDANSPFYRNSYKLAMALIKVDHKIKVVSMLKFCCCCSYCCKCVTTKRKFACTFEKIALVHITSHHITALCLSRNSKINMAFGRRKTATTLFHFPFHVVVNLVESLTRPPLFLLLFSTCFFASLLSLRRYFNVVAFENRKENEN